MSKNVWYWIADEAALIDLAADFPISALLATIGVCIFFLSKGADWMVDGAVCLAQRTGLPRIVIGATIISLGTTTPEAFVSVTAAWMGNPGLALGNGVGSIICDTGLIFGICCLLTVMPVKRDILNRTGWVQVGSATLLVCISLIALATTDGEPVLQRWVGIFFLMLLVCYLFASYVWAKNSGNDHEKDPGDESLCKALPMIVAGLAGVIVGSRILVPFTGEFAGRVGVPDDIIAATMVAFGTSVPGTRYGYRRHQQGTARNHRRQHRRSGRPELPVRHRSGGRSKPPGDPSHVFHLPLPGDDRNPVFVSDIHLSQQGRNVQAMAGCLDTRSVYSVPRAAVFAEFRAGGRIKTTGRFTTEKRRREV